MLDCWLYCATDHDVLGNHGLATVCYYQDSYSYVPATLAGCMLERGLVPVCATPTGWFGVAHNTPCHTQANNQRKGWCNMMFDTTVTMILKLAVLDEPVYIP